jgi:uncharacterized protein (DUF4415 family)
MKLTCLYGGIIVKPLKEHISITIDADVLEKAKTESEKFDRSLSQFINIVLKDYFNSDKKSDSLQNTLEGR